jgi:hypothetical protein
VTKKGVVGVSYATIEQYEARYGLVEDEAMLQECLDDCSALIEVELDRYGVDYADPSETLADRLMRACRSMAHRVMPSDDGAEVPVGATQVSRTAGPYSEQFTLATTYDTPKVTDEERKLLGIYGARIGFGALAGRDD